MVYIRCKNSQGVHYPFLVYNYYMNAGTKGKPPKKTTECGNQVIIHSELKDLYFLYKIFKFPNLKQTAKKLLTKKHIGKKMQERSEIVISSASEWLTDCEPRYYTIPQAMHWNKVIVWRSRTKFAKLFEKFGNNRSTFYEAVPVYFLRESNISKQRRASMKLFYFRSKCTVINKNVHIF